jgi:hypothetical protein
LNTIFYIFGIVVGLIMVLLSWQAHRTARIELEQLLNRRHEDEERLRAAAALLQAWSEINPGQMDIFHETRGLLADIKGALVDADEELC